MRESTFTLVYWGLIPSFPTKGELVHGPSKHYLAGNDHISHPSAKVLAAPLPGLIAKKWAAKLVFGRFLFTNMGMLKVQTNHRLYKSVARRLLIVHFLIFFVMS